LAGRHEQSPDAVRDVAIEVSLAAPAYNEEEGIASVITEWRDVLTAAGVSFEIVICNDGSRDQTGTILSDLSRSMTQLRTVGGAVNRGYGHALSTAIAHCKGAYIATIDSDGQFDPAAIVDFLVRVKAENADGVAGYRDRKRDSLLRVLADRALNLIVRGMFRTRLRDTNCALKLIRRDLLQSLPLEATGFPLPTEVCIRLEAAGVRLVEAPVRHRERLAGESKLRVWSTGWKMGWFLVYLRLRLALFRARVLRQF
jgi:dolichol-phosphate mannosyltransferase